MSSGYGGCSSVLLWPQLLTNYHGRPPAQADVINALGMLASFGVCGVAIMIFHGLLDDPASRGLDACRR